MDSYSDISDRSPEEFGIETIDFKVSSSVNLSVQQKLLVGCVLDVSIKSIESSQLPLIYSFSFSKANQP